MNPIFQQLGLDAGIHFMGVNPEFQEKDARIRQAFDGSFACDAQPSLVTVSNSGIPAFLTTYIDPKLVEVLVSPMKCAEIVGDETKKGDWLTETAMFPVVESTGETSGYGDYSTSGVAGVNTNFPQRQSFHYQVMTQWGEKELERAGLARIDFANRLNMASILTLNKYQNKTYFFGVSGLQNYGLFNDPSLSAAIAPTTKAAGGTTWALATGLEVVADIAKLYKQLQSQAKGTIDVNTPMTLAMSPLSEADGMLKPSVYMNTNVREYLKTLYPNMVIKTAPEYSTASGELVQLLVNELDGQQTATCGFTEKLRAHPVIVKASSFEQKKSQGTWGTVIFRPFLIAQMIGV